MSVRITFLKLTERKPSWRFEPTLTSSLSIGRGSSLEHGSSL